MIKKEYSVVVTGCFGQMNLGDDALAISVVDVVKKYFSVSEIALECKNNIYISNQIPGIVQLCPNNLILPNGYLYVYGGGTLFYSFRDSKKNKYNKALKVLTQPKKIANYFMARSIPLKKRFSHISAISIGVGPFEADDKSLKKTRDIITQCDYVSLRDLYSYELCKNVGIGELRFDTDICFSSKYCVPTGSANCFNKNKIIGVIVRDWPHNNRYAKYQDVLLAAINDLKRKDYKFIFYSFCEINDRFWNKKVFDNNDIIYIYDPSKHAIGDYLNKLHQCDAIITSRYHGGVFSALMNKPMIIIDLEQKLKYLSEVLNCSEFVWSYPFEKESLIKKVEELFVDYKGAVEKVAAATYKCQAKSLEMVSNYSRYLEKIIAERSKNEL